MFRFLPTEKDYCVRHGGDVLTTTDGTGIVHIAPAFGADDLTLGKENDLPVLHTVDLEGKFIPAVTPWAGGLRGSRPTRRSSAHLQERGLMIKAKTYTHTYPFCWRCDTPLLYYAKTSWYIETTA